MSGFGCQICDVSLNS